MYCRGDDLHPESSALDVWKKVAKTSALLTGEPSSTRFEHLMQSLSVVIQRANARAILMRAVSRSVRFVLPSLLCVFPCLLPSPGREGRGSPPPVPGCVLNLFLFSPSSHADDRTGVPLVFFILFLFVNARENRGASGGVSKPPPHAWSPGAPRGTGRRGGRRLHASPEKN